MAQLGALCTLCLIISCVLAPMISIYYFDRLADPSLHHRTSSWVVVGLALDKWVMVCFAILGIGSAYTVDTKKLRIFSTILTIYVCIVFAMAYQDYSVTNRYNQLLLSIPKVSFFYYKWNETSPPSPVDVNELLDDLHEVGCCGYTDANDWDDVRGFDTSRFIYPKICCPSYVHECSSLSIYRKGCFERRQEVLNTVLTIWTGLIVSKAVVIALATLVICCIEKSQAQVARALSNSLNEDPNVCINVNNLTSNPNYRENLGNVQLSIASGPSDKQTAEASLYPKLV